MGWFERITSIVAGVAVVAAVSVMVAKSETKPMVATAHVAVSTPTVAPATKAPTPEPTKIPAAVKAFPTLPSVAAVSTTAIAGLHKTAAENSPLVGYLLPGTLLPVGAHTGNFFYVMTPQEHFGWVTVTKVKQYAPGKGNATSLKDATIVIDPGHGGSQSGALGPSRYPEKDPNLGISKRVITNLGGVRTFITRGFNTAGLNYRSALANRLKADAFISIHNNSAPRFLNSKAPGTETYYQQGSPRSKRLAGLIYEELSKSLRRFRNGWIKTKFAGAKYRKGQGGHDYYSVLRETHVPAVIVEGMYISHAPEEALLKNGAVRQLMADAITRGIKRYFNTKDAGSGFIDPYAILHQGGQGTFRP